MASRLPDYLIIGAPKAATTSLATWIDRHPRGFLSQPKELNFFTWRYGAGLDWYREQFAAAPEDSVAGEATPTYLAVPEALERIATDLPLSRFVVVLREPVERAWSHYWYEVGNRREHRSFAQVIEEELRAPPTEQRYLHHGRYAEHLERWSDVVDRSRILVMAFDDVRDDPARAFADVCQFLGIPTAEVTAPVGDVRNARFRVRSQLVRNVMLRYSLWRRLPFRLGHRLEQLNRATLEVPALGEDARRQLTDWYADDVQRLGGWLEGIPGRWQLPDEGQPQLGKNGEPSTES